MKKTLSILLSIFIATAVIGLGFRFALALNYIDFSGADTQDIRWPAGQTLSFVQGGSERLRIDATTGNVVIPQGLTVNGTFSMTGTYTGSVSAGNISAGDFGSNYGGGIFSFPGNVGIGTTSPGAKLDIYTSTNTDGIKIGAGLTGTGVSPASANIYISPSGDSATYPNIRNWVISTFYEDAGALSFRNSNTAGGSAYGAGTTRLIITRDGNVGIGTTSPTQILHIAAATSPRILIDNIGGGAAKTAALRFAKNGVGNWVLGSDNITGNGSDVFSIYGGSPGSHAFVIDTSGNVGIGTTDPGTFRLNVQGGNLRHTGAMAYFGTGTSAQITGLVYDAGVSTSYDLLTLENNNGTQFLVQGTGNVGIGTTSPAVKLDIEGNLKIYNGGGGWSYVLAADGRQLSLGVDNGVSLNLTGGNVGIGTTSPGAKLDVNGTLNAHNAMTVQAGAGNIVGGLSWASTDNGQLYLNNGGATTINIMGSGNTYFNGGNVGIGMTSPAQKLHIKGGDNAGLRLNASDYGNGYIQMTGRDQNIAGTVSSFYHTIDVKMKTQGDNGGNGVETTIMQLFKEGWGGGDIVAFPRGNVGIGYTDTSGNKLAVNGTIYAITINASASGGLCIAGDCKTAWSQVGGGPWTTSGNNIYNNNSGNVGIGTTSPSVTGRGLHIYNTSDAMIKVDTAGVAGGNAYFTGTSGSPTGDMYVTNTTARNLYLGTGSQTATHVTINSAGNVGIGTTSPGQKLEVAGAADAPIIQANFNGQTGGIGIDSSATYWGTSLFVQGTKLFTLDANGGIIVGSGYMGYNAPANGAIIQGNVGIGTTGPLTRLVVQGTTSENTELQVNSVATNLNAVIRHYDGTNSVYSGLLGAVGGGAGNWGVYAGGVRMVVTQSGNVGIGTSSPNILFQTKAARNGDWVGGFVNTGTTPYGLYIDTTANAGSQYTLAAYTNAGTGMFVLNNGSVGIGTTSPANKLSLYGSGSDVALLSLNVDSGSMSRMWFRDSGATYNDFEIDVDHTGNKLYIQDNDTTIAAFYGGGGAGNGALGLRTTSTYGYALYAEGSGYFSGSVGAPQLCIGASCQSSWPGSQWTTSGNNIYNSNSGNVGIGTTDSQSALDVITPANSFVSVGSAQMGVGAYAGIHFGYREANTLYRKSAIVFERTDNAGFGGNAAGKVHILNGPASGSGSATLADARLTIAELGNVGIGTTGPKKLLNVHGTGALESGIGATTITDATVALKLGTTGTRAGSGYYMAGIGFANLWNYAGGSGYDANNHAWIGTYHESTPGSELASLVFATNPNTDNVGLPAERMRITSAGNVGIGTTGPQYKVHINAATTIPNNRNLNFDSAGSEIGVGNMFLTVGQAADNAATSIPTAVGIILQNNSNADNTYDPLLAWSSQSASGGYSQMTAGLAGRRVTAGPDANWHGGELHFYTANNTGTYGLMDRMVIDKAGNVGIGTSPGVKLQVAGAIRNSAPAAGYLELSGLLPGYSDNQYPTLKTDGTWIYLSTAGTYSGYYGDSGMRARAFYDYDSESYYVNPASTSVTNIIQSNSYFLRGSHSSGYLAGSYNNIGGNSTYSNPIYTIGTSYAPSDSSLLDMYGIGYSHGNFWGSAGGRTTGWGMYVAADGDIRVILDAENGVVWSSASTRSPIFYDTDNTAYYVNPAGASTTSEFYRSYGFNGYEYDGNNSAYYVDPSYTSYFNYMGRNYGFNWTEYDWNNTAYYVDPNNTSIYNDLRANIFYDYGNTGYYVDPASTSNLNAANFAGGVYTQITSTSGTNYGLTAGATGSGASFNIGGQFTASGALSNQAVGIAGPSSAANNYAIYSSATAQSYFAGNVGIGTSSPGSLLDIKSGGMTAELRVTNYEPRSIYIRAGQTTGAQIGTTTSHNLYLMTVDTNRVTIDTSGRVGIGRIPSTTNKLEVEGNASKTTSGSWLANSDLRIKKDIVPAGGLKLLSSLNPVAFRYTDEYRAMHPAIEDKVYYNFIAQEFAEVFPDFVKGSGEFLPNGREILQIDPYPAQVVAIKAIKELASSASGQQKQIESLLAMMGRFAIDENGTLIVNSIETKKGITTYDTETGKPYCIRVTNGAAVTVAGKCE